MTELDGLLDELKRVLVPKTVSYTTRSKPWDVYEGYVFSLAVQVAAEARASVEFRGANGCQTSDLVFRTAPGNLWSRLHNYTHAHISFDGVPPLEIHIGVMAEGASSVAHECDVLILLSREADYCRQNHAVPRAKYCVAAIECKYYSSPLPLGMARAFEGLCADTKAMGEVLLVSNTQNANSVTYLQKWKRSWERKVLPREPQVESLKAKIRKALRDHVVTYAPDYDI
jgi:hypothetical protein